MANLLNRAVAGAASSLANPTSATVFKLSADSTRAASVSIPIESGATSARFRVRARGRATTGTTSNFLATIQYTTDVTSTSCATATNNTDAVALTNRSYATITRPWTIDAEFVWDSTSGRLSGQKNGLNAETIETANAAITALTSIDLTTRKCGFVVSAIFGSTNASNVAVLDELVLEVL